MPLLFPASGAKVAAAFSVANSCRFNAADSSSLTKTSASGNHKTWTFSCWFKKGSRSSYGAATNVEDHLMSNNTGSNAFFIRLGEEGTGVGGSHLDIGFYNGSSYILRLTSNASYRDHGAWYHFLVCADTTQSTPANRFKVFVNGTQVTSWSTETYPDQDEDGIDINDGETLYVGNQTTGHYTDGYFAEVVLIDGTQYTNTDFGEFDEDSPMIWKPIKVSGLTFGTNGFYLDFKDSANLGNDANGGTDLTESNLAAVDQATDSPTNNFAVMNPMVRVVTGPGTFSQGNCQIQGGSGDACYVSTLGMKTGKWYFEAKVSNRLGAMSDGSVSALLYSDGGIQDLMGAGTQYRGCAYAANGKGYPGNGGSTNTSYGATYDINDIIGVLLNLDDGEITFEKADADQGALVTDISDYQKNEHWFFAVQAAATDQYAYCNFGGCPAFAISSGNADANGYGNFEYAVPSGYYALCTKNLAEFG